LTLLISASSDETPALKFTGDILPLSNGINYFIFNGTIETDTGTKLGAILNKLSTISISTTTPPTDVGFSDVDIFTMVIYDPLELKYYSNLKIEKNKDEKNNWQFAKQVLLWDENLEIPETQKSLNLLLIFQFGSPITTLIQFSSTVVNLEFISGDPLYPTPVSLSISLYRPKNINEESKSSSYHEISPLLPPISPQTPSSPSQMTHMQILTPLPFATAGSRVGVQYVCKLTAVDKCTSFQTLYLTLPQMKTELYGLDLSFVGISKWGSNDSEDVQSGETVPSDEISIEVTLNGRPVIAKLSKDMENLQYSRLIIPETYTFLPNLDYSIIIPLEIAVSKDLQDDSEHIPALFPLPARSDYSWLQLYSKTAESLQSTGVGTIMVYSLINMNFVAEPDIPTIFTRDYPFTGPTPKMMTIGYQFRYPSLHLQQFGGNNEHGIGSLGKLKGMVRDGLGVGGQNQIDANAVTFQDVLQFSILNPNSTNVLRPLRLDLSVTTSSGLFLDGFSVLPVNENQNYQNHSAQTDATDLNGTTTILFPTVPLQLSRYFTQSLVFNLTCVFYFDAKYGSLDQIDPHDPNFGHSLAVHTAQTDPLSLLQITLGLIRQRSQSDPQFDPQAEPPTTTLFTQNYLNTLSPTKRLSRDTRIVTYSNENEYKNDHLSHFSIILSNVLQPIHSFQVFLSTPTFQFVGSFSDCRLSSGELTPDQSTELVDPKSLTVLKDTYGKGYGVSYQPNDTTFTIGMSYNFTCPDLTIGLFPRRPTDWEEQFKKAATLVIVADLDQKQDQNQSSPDLAGTIISFIVSPPTPNPTPDPRPKPTIWVRALLWACLGFIVCSLLLVTYKLHQRHAEFKIYREKRREKRRKQYTYVAGNVAATPKRTEATKLLGGDHGSGFPPDNNGGNNNNYGGNVPSSPANKDPNTTISQRGGSFMTDHGGNYGDSIDIESNHHYGNFDTFSEMSSSNPYQQRSLSCTISGTDDVGSTSGYYYRPPDAEDGDTFFDWLFSSNTSFWNGNGNGNGKQGRIDKVQSGNKCEKIQSAQKTVLSLRGGNNRNNLTKTPKSQHNGFFAPSSLPTIDASHPYANYDASIISSTDLSYYQNNTMASPQPPHLPDDINNHDGNHDEFKFDLDAVEDELRLSTEFDSQKSQLNRDLFDFDHDSADQIGPVITIAGGESHGTPSKAPKKKQYYTIQATTNVAPKIAPKDPQVNGSDSFQSPNGDSKGKNLKHLPVDGWGHGVGIGLNQKVKSQQYATVNAFDLESELPANNNNNNNNKTESHQQKKRNRQKK
jgi:hypothetical protein